MTSYKRLIAIDFDGVLHSYRSTWTDVATISDPPTPGAMAFLRAVHSDPRFEVCVVSSRCGDELGKRAVERWLYRHLDEAFGTEGRILAEDIPVRSERPPAHITIDDRGWRFEGQWPSLDEMAAFKPWNKRPTGPAEGRAEIDALIVRTAAARSASRPAPAVDLDLLREVARRAYAAGCESLEFHEEDCQAEVREILDDVLGRMKVAAEYDAQAVRIASEGLVARFYPPAVMVEEEEGNRG